jgi:cyclase
MLKVRIIPVLLWKDYTLVKGTGFDSWRRIGTLIPSIRVYNQRQVDELIIVDITATRENREPDYQAINDFSQECFMPLTFGGGVRTLAQIQKLLRVGADKVAINSAAYSSPELIRDGARTFGSQCIVASVDVRKVNDDYECFRDGGQIATGQKLDDWVRKLEDLGAGEILLTSIDRDGMMNGYDLDLISRVVEKVQIPVIVQGGCSSYEDMHLAIQRGASAVSAASIFHFTEQTPLGAKKYLADKGVSVRL